MDAAVALLLAQDGITNGAIYALLSLALVLVFAVTRVIYIPQGEFVAYGALSMAAVNAGFLLYHRTEGFAFVIDAEDGWSWSAPITGAPEKSGGGVSYQGVSYRKLYDYTGMVTYVLGESGRSPKFFASLGKFSPSGSGTDTNNAPCTRSLFCEAQCTTIKHAKLCATKTVFEPSESIFSSSSLTHTFRSGKSQLECSSLLNL